MKKENQKAEKLANKINSITEAFSEKLNDVNSLLVTSDEIISETDNFVQTELTNSDDIPAILNLDNMVHDIKYIRETLKESTEAGKKLLKSMATEIEIEPNARLLEAYSHLGSVINENMKLYLQCYKDISTIMLNYSKSKNSNPKSVTNITVEAEPNIKNTAELIKQLSELKNE